MSWFPLPVSGSRSARPLNVPLLKLAAAALLLVVGGGCASPPPTPAPTPARAAVDPEQPAREAEARGDYGAAAQAWQALAASRPSPGREAYQLRAAAAWLAAGDTTSSQALLGQIDVAPLGDALITQKQLLLARLALGRGDPVAAAAALAPTLELEPPADLATERDALVQRLPPGSFPTPGPALTGGDFLAVLLPYGGSLDSAAQAITTGIVAARLHDGSGPELRFYASGNDVVTSYRQALADGAAAVIGPLQKAEVAALAKSPLPRPTLALNNPEPAVGQVNLYRLSLDPADEAAAGAQWLAAAGYRDVAMLYVDDAWGRRLRDLYSAALVGQGGRLSGAVPFDAGDTEFAAALRGLFGARLAGTVPAPPDESGVSSAAAPTPPGPQALIVIASATDARQVVPQLAYVGVFGLPVLTTSQVWSGSPEAADTDLQNVVFCDSPWALNRQTLSGDSGPLTAARQAWPQLDREPPRLLALGADAYAVGRELRLGRTVDALPEGLTGALGLDADGTLHRRVLACARFSGGVPVPLTPGGSP